MRTAAPTALIALAVIFFTGGFFACASLVSFFAVLLMVLVVLAVGALAFSRAGLSSAEALAIGLLALRFFAVAPSFAGDVRLFGFLLRRLDFIFLLFGQNPCGLVMNGWGQ